MWSHKMTFARNIINKEQHERIRSLPGNMTVPRINSAIMQPTDQISTEKTNKQKKTTTTKSLDHYSFLSLQKWEHGKMEEQRW